MGVASTSNALRPDLKYVADDPGGADPREVVRAQHPLIVLGDELAGDGEALRRGDGAQRVDDAVVETDEGKVRLGDNQVLVVARVGNNCLAPGGRARPGAPRKVKAGSGGETAGRDGVARPQVKAVGLVELRRPWIARPGAVEGIEVESRRAPLEQPSRRDGLAQHRVSPVEAQVVIDELTQVGEAGRDPGVAGVTEHRRAQRGESGLAELVTCAARPHAREAKRRRSPLGDRRKGPGAPAGTLAEQSFAEDEEALGAVPHRRLTRA